MTKEQADTIVQKAREDGYGVSLYDDYSGRCMYGEETCAVSFNERYEFDQFFDDHKLEHRTDNLGLGMIVY